MSRSELDDLPRAGTPNYHRVVNTSDDRLRIWFGTNPRPYELDRHEETLVAGPAVYITRVEHLPLRKGLMKFSR